MIPVNQSERAVTCTFRVEALLKLWFLVLSLNACGARSGLELGSESVGGAGAAGTAASGGGGANAAGQTFTGGAPPAAAGASGGGGGGAALPIAAIAISAGTDSTCAVKGDGTVWCWGANDHAQLGNGTTQQSSVPVQVTGITSAIAIEAGGTWTSGGKGAGRSAFNCAVLRGGDVMCWGNVPGIAVQSQPVLMPLHHAEAVAGGNWHACALLEGGTVSCWGDNRYGQLGDATTTNSAEPVPVLGIHNATSVVGHGSDFTCAALPGGTVECWGGSFDRVGSTPIVVPGIAAKPGGLGAGYRIGACAVSPDGSVQCWSSPGTDPPVPVPGINTAVAVTVGLSHACALLSEGTIQCWGMNQWGQLGGASAGAAVSDIRGAVAVSAGYNYTCALLNTGAIWCWGTNHNGQLGNGIDASDRSEWMNFAPVRVRGF